MNASSLSTLCFITNLQILSNNWKCFNREPCVSCKTRGPHFETIKSLEEIDKYWKDEQELKLGYLTCRSCVMKSKTRYLHRSCSDDGEAISGEYKCEDCTEVIGLFFDGFNFHRFIYQ